MKLFQLCLLTFFSIAYIQGQHIIYSEADKCGIPPTVAKNSTRFAEKYWGYSYDSLIHDLNQWQLSDYVSSISLGKSYQNRDIYELIITDNNVVNTDKLRIYIHARTHPNEVQSFWVTDEIINYLLNNPGIGKYLRERCVFHIVPMYNPDGVELELDRYNANGVDIESNWSDTLPEKEVVNLRNRFSDLMLKENPIKIALNMHSAYACKRYFVYHHENGTSLPFTDLEKKFIGSVKDHYYEGIEPYTYYISWQGGTPKRYPESWWWLNYKEEVMALTYEDMNCNASGFYDKTAFAILHGISDYLNLGYVSLLNSVNSNPLKVKVYPNPFHDNLVVEWNNFNQADKVVISDIFGTQIRFFTRPKIMNGLISWNGLDENGNKVPAGTYILQLFVNGQLKTAKIIKQ